MQENQNEDFETYLKASSPYKGLKFFEKTFEYLAEKTYKEKKQLIMNLYKRADEKPPAYHLFGAYDESSYKEALSNFISYASEHCFDINKLTIVLYRTKHQKKLSVRECILAKIANEEYRIKTSGIINGHIEEKIQTIQSDDFKGLVLDIRY